MAFRQILEKYRSEALHEADKGKMFERLMLNFLKTFPVYESKFRSVWLWRDFPYHAEISAKDVGVDLVAETTDGDFWACQCKCYQEKAYISKHQVDTFLGPSGKEFRGPHGKPTRFAARLWICTTNNWSSEAEAELDKQSPPCLRLSLSDLEAAPVDWDLLDAGRFGPEARRGPRELREHQRTALEASVKHFADHDRGIATMACGTGKTLLSLKISERLTNNSGLILFLAPSIALVRQTLYAWAEDAISPLRAVCVCSDPTVSQGGKKSGLDEDLTGVKDLALPATTDVPTIVRNIKMARAENRGVR